MTKIRLLTVAVVGLLIVNFGLLAFLILNRPGGPPRGGRMPEVEGPKKMIIKKLDLDKAQINAYELLIERHQAASRELNDEMKNAKNRLYATLTSDTEQGSDSLINQLGTLQKQIEKVHYEHFIEVKKLCRPDQEVKFQELTRELAGFFAMPKNLPPGR